MFSILMREFTRGLRYGAAVAGACEQGVRPCRAYHSGSRVRVPWLLLGPTFSTGGLPEHLKERIQHCLEVSVKAVEDQLR
jgi:hypothetical protein